MKLNTHFSTGFDFNHNEKLVRDNAPANATNSVLNIIIDLVSSILLLTLGATLLIVLSSIAPIGVALAVVGTVLMVWMFVQRRNRIL